MIKKVTGYQIDGMNKVFDTIEEAYQFEKDMQKRARYEEIHKRLQELGIHNHLKSGRIDVDEFISDIREFMELRKYFVSKTHNELL